MSRSYPFVTQDLVNEAYGPAMTAGGLASDNLMGKPNE